MIIPRTSLEDDAQVDREPQTEDDKPEVEADISIAPRVGFQNPNDAGC
jgi:hypothetical protein